MKKSEETMLTPSQEKLLSKFIDGECNWFERWQVGNLQRRNPHADQFIANLKADLKKARELPGALGGQHAPVDLWQKISNRIDQEERAAFFLGQRQSPRQKGYANLFDSISGGLTWGLSGAVAAMLVLYLTSNTPHGVPGGSGVQFVSGEGAGFNGNISNVSLNPGVKASRPPKLIERRYPVTLEVDWMRSDGRVRVMPDSGDRSAIIWVKRRSHGALAAPASAAPRGEASSWTVIDQNSQE